MAPHLYFYLQANKPKGRRIAELIQQGLGRDRVTVMSPGDNFRARGVTMIWGAWHNTLPIYRRCVAESLPFIYWDNGYFGYKRAGERWHRAVWGAMQHDGPGEPTAAGRARLDRMGVEVRPWRRSGSRRVLVALQTADFYDRFLGRSRDEWLAGVESSIRRHGFEPVVREKPGKRDKNPPPPLADQLADCRAVVGYTSAVLVEAALAGVPVFPTHPCAASPVGTSDLDRLGSPVYPPGREAWAARLAGQCWSEGDLRTGRWWRELERP